jgi:cytochrome c oxidase assembly protein subunit 15
MLWFFIKKQIPQTYKPIIIVLFLGGGLQGLVGWFMVKSGLIDRVSVSQYRLALHLGLALILYYCVLHTAILLYQRNFFSLPKYSPIALFTILVFLQIISGAFTAGTHAGYIYNTYPLMDNALVPSGLFSGGVISVFEDVMTIQFIHRTLALCVLVFALFISIQEIQKKNYKDAIILLAVILLQVILGIVTLVTVAPVNHIELAALHQCGSVLVLSVCCYLNARIA